MMEVVVPARHELGECVLWCERTQRLLWTDIPAATLWAFAPATGERRSWPMPEPLCCFALTASDDRLLLGLASGLAFFDFPTGAVTRICAVEGHLPSTRLNDGRCDRQGRFVFGTFNSDSDPRAPIGSFYRVNHDLTLERLPLGGVAIANSICFSPDGRTMYYADSQTLAIHCCDYHPCSGAIGNPRVFVAAGAVPGEPDGSTVDADGCLWSTRWGGAQVVRFTPGGGVDLVLDLAAPQPSCPAFGGPALDVLYVTTARQWMSDVQLADAPHSGSVFARGMALRGLPEQRFLGRGSI